MIVNVKALADLHIGQIESQRGRTGLFVGRFAENLLETLETFVFVDLGAKTTCIDQINKIAWSYFFIAITIIRFFATFLFDNDLTPLKK